VIRRLLTLFWLAMGVTPVNAAESLAIVNAHIYSMGGSGELANGTVLIRDGKIAAIGAVLEAPPSARVIDAGGKVVTPGFVATDTSLGLLEIRAGADADDSTTNSSSVSAAFDVSYGLNHDSVVIPVTRLGGITHAVVVPSYAESRGAQHLFAGQAAVITLGAAMPLLVKSHVAMVLAMGKDGADREGGGRGAQAAVLRAILSDVRDYVGRRQSYDRGESRKYLLGRADLEALGPVVEGRMPVLVWVRRASDILDVLALARQERLKIILDGASEAWRVADAIARAGVSVLLTPIENTPASFDALGATLENAALLQRAGVTVIIKGNGAHRERELRYNAGNAVAAGMPYLAALAAITINPAHIFGLDHSGSLEPGKDADLVMWDGDPLEPLTRPTAIFIGGREQPVTSRATQLRDRYLSAPAAASATTEAQNGSPHAPDDP
jgi:imidazolonepropionase-like amidohydrolase